MTRSNRTWRNPRSFFKGKTLTIEPCAVVQIGAGQYIYVNGALVADGTAAQPIAIGQQTVGQRNQPFDGMIANTTISHSAMQGIDRAWDGASTPSFLSAVTFDDIKGCHETVPRDINNACPSTIPCP